MNNKTILLVEDDPNDIELTLMGLSEYCVSNSIVVNKDGSEALDYLFCRGDYAGRQSGHPDLILLDIKMPKVDGLEVLREIKNDSVLKSIPVVMMTSSEQERDIYQSYKNNANAYIVKPVAFEAFMQAVKSIGMFWINHNKTVAES